MSWLPIESAPRNGTSVLFYLMWDEGEFAEVGEFDGDELLTPSACNPHVFTGIRAVCWQPLPEPPTDDRWELTEAGRAMRGGK